MYFHVQCTCMLDMSVFLFPTCPLLGRSDSGFQRAEPFRWWWGWTSGFSRIQVGHFLNDHSNNCRENLHVHVYFYRFWTHQFLLGERERAHLVVRQARFFWRDFSIYSVYISFVGTSCRNFPFTRQRHFNFPRVRSNVLPGAHVSACRLYLRSHGVFSKR